MSSAAVPDPQVRKLQGRCRCGRVRQRQKSEDGETYGYLCGGCSKPTSSCSCLPLLAGSPATKTKPSAGSITASEMGKRSARKVPKGKRAARMSELGKASGVARAEKANEGALARMIADLRK